MKSVLVLRLQILTSQTNNSLLIPGLLCNLLSLLVHSYLQAVALVLLLYNKLGRSPKLPQLDLTLSCP